MVGIVVTSRSSMILGLVSASSERATTRTRTAPQAPARGATPSMGMPRTRLVPDHPWESGTALAAASRARASGLALVMGTAERRGSYCRGRMRWSWCGSRPLAWSRAPAGLPSLASASQPCSVCARPHPATGGNTTRHRAGIMVNVPDDPHADRPSGHLVLQRASRPTAAGAPRKVRVRMRRLSWRSRARGAGHDWARP